MEVSIVIPVFNEEELISDTIKKITSYFKNKNYEIILVDDGSTDCTLSKISSMSSQNLKIIRNYKNFGKGYSVKRGILHTSGDFILYTDADLSTPIEDYEKLEKMLKNGFDIVMGSRLLKNSKIIQNQSIIRIFFGKLFGICAHALVCWKFRDTQCGFKLLKGDVARDVFKSVEIKGYSFDIEMILIALKKNYKIAEVPVTWKNNPKSKIRLLSTVYINVFLELFKIFVKRLRRIY